MDIESVLGKDIDVYLIGDSDTGDAITLCKVFIDDGVPMVDFIPKLNRKYVAPLPDDAIVSTNEVELSAGRYGVFISRQSPAGQLAVALLDSKERGRRPA